MLTLLLAAALASPPNVVVIFADDLGYGDLSCYGNRKFRTPNLDRMAQQGMRFTDFYSASPGCSPSRAALLTGCYPQRVSVPQVLNPDSPTGLNPEEETVAELLKRRGYATAAVGKWHLGVKNLMPLAHGFDTFFGLPYSNDMWPVNGKNWPELPLFQDDRAVETIDDLEEQGELTGRYTKFALEFIQRNRKKPFFLYLAHSMPHVPIAASKRFQGRSRAGLYGDVVQELDDSTGQILNELNRLKLDRNTLVIFTSDNGPWIPYGDHAGSTGGLREGKGTTFEGGIRVPGIFWMPGTIPADRVNGEVATTMDLLPTITGLAGADRPKLKIDGHDLRPLLSGGSNVRSPWKWLFAFWPAELQAVRSGDWKLHVPHNHRHQEGAPGKGGKSAGEVTRRIELSLFELSVDPNERTNLAERHPETVRRLERLIAIGRRELGDPPRGAVGAEVRAPGRVREGR